MSTRHQIAKEAPIVKSIIVASFQINSQRPRAREHRTRSTVVPLPGTETVARRTLGATLEAALENALAMLDWVVLAVVGRLVHPLRAGRME
jgi:hypothetical protein